MKGLALLGRILAVLGMGILWVFPAHAAAPRDAIRKLPSIDTNIRWVTEPDGKDNFQASWDVRWNSGKIRAGAFSANINFQYRLSFTDNQVSSENFTYNRREDSYNYKIDLEKRGYLSGYYQFTHNENTGDRFPSNGNANKELRNEKQASLTLEAKDAPRISILTQEITSANYDGNVFRRGNDTILWRGQADHKGNTPEGGYAVQVISESRLSRELSESEPRESSFDKLQLSGTRNMKIGNMGQLNMDVKYLEDSKRNPAQEDSSTYTDLNYVLSFGGNLPNYPLNYRFVYNSHYWGNLDNASNRNALRVVELSYRPPTPEGRNLNINYVNQLQDTFNQNSSTAIAIQTLALEFNPNKRTRGSLKYESKSNFNNDTAQITEENNSIQGELYYTMPGEANRYYVGFFQQQVIGSNRINSREYTKYTYNASSRLGRQANIRMEIAQAYDDRYTQGNLVTVPSDTLLTSVVYDFTGQMPGGAGGSFNLQAIWDRNLTRRAQTGFKNDQHKLTLNLAYNAPANWRYELHLKATDGWQYNGVTDLSDRYSSTEDRIEAFVSHRF